MRTSIISLLAMMILVTLPAMAQDQQMEEPASAIPTTRTVAMPVAGQRLSREQVAAEASIEPMARINGRIQNRVQSRIRNRIDRYYDPQANATSPFEVAGDQARAAGRPRR